MPMKIDRKKAFEISESMLEILGFLHGAIDPDSGHIVCHHYRLGVLYAKHENNIIPLFGVENCLFVTAGEENISAIISSDDAVKIETLSVSGGRLTIGDIDVENYWIFLALSFVREIGGKLSFYKLGLILEDKKEVKAVALLAEPKDSTPVMLIVPSKCVSQEKKELTTHI